MQVGSLISLKFHNKCIHRNFFVTALLKNPVMLSLASHKRKNFVAISFFILLFLIAGSILFQFSFKRKKSHPIITFFWVASPIFSLFSGAALYDNLLKYNKLEIYHEYEYVIGAGIFSFLSCIGLNVIFRPILIKLFPLVFEKIHLFYWVIASYIIPLLIVLLETAIVGLPWEQRIHIP